MSDPLPDIHFAPNKTKKIWRLHSIANRKITELWKYEIYGEGRSTLNVALQRAYRDMMKIAKSGKHRNIRMGTDGEKWSVSADVVVMNDETKEKYQAFVHHTEDALPRRTLGEPARWKILSINGVEGSHYFPKLKVGNFPGEAWSGEQPEVYFYSCCKAEEIATEIIKKTDWTLEHREVDGNLIVSFVVGDSLGERLEKTVTLPAPSWEVDAIWDEKKEWASWDGRGVRREFWGQCLRRVGFAFAKPEEFALLLSSKWQTSNEAEEAVFEAVAAVINSGYADFGTLSYQISRTNGCEVLRRSIPELDLRRQLQSTGGHDAPSEEVETPHEEEELEP